VSEADRPADVEAWNERAFSDPAQPETNWRDDPSGAPMNVLKEALEKIIAVPPGYHAAAQMQGIALAALKSHESPPQEAPPKMLIDADWLRRKVETDPDMDADVLPAQPQTSAWQPYATAPRDGTPILCYWGPSAPGGARAIDVAVWIDGNWCNADDTGTHFGEPDLWRPLDWPALSSS
jgi:hypothetical protein